MSLLLAIRRSYRHFLPPPLLEPRKCIRQIWRPIFFCLMGLTMGMYVYARPNQIEHVTEISIIALLALFLLKWWAGGEPK